MIYLNVPGLRNSGPNHWQSLWEQQDPALFRRIEQEDWAAPSREDWVPRIQEVLQSYSAKEIILIGHSVGCAAIIHWFKDYQLAIRGALLVAPSDVDRSDYPSYIKGFAPMPLTPLPFPSIVVASSNDHVVSPERAAFFAQSWGSQFVLIKNAGHLEDQAGFGPWPQGLELLQSIKVQVT